jgi:hypothetical protein
MEGRKIYDYRWREPFGTNWYTTRCEVIGEYPKSLKIKLLGCGKNGMRPGTELTVRKASVIGWQAEQKKATATVDDGWKEYTYFY